MMPRRSTVKGRGRPHWASRTELVQQLSGTTRVPHNIVLLVLAIAALSQGVTAGKTAEELPSVSVVDRCAAQQYSLGEPQDTRGSRCIDMPTDPAASDWPWLGATVHPECGCALMAINTLNDWYLAYYGESGLSLWGFLSGLWRRDIDIHQLNRLVEISQKDAEMGKFFYGWGVERYTRDFVLSQSSYLMKRLPFSFVGRLVDLTKGNLHPAPLFQCPSYQPDPSSEGVNERMSRLCFGTPEGTPGDQSTLKFTAWEQARGLGCGYEKPMDTLGDPEGTLFYASMAFKDPPVMTRRMVHALHHRFDWAGPQTKTAIDALGTAWAKMKSPQQYYCAHRMMLELGTRYDIGSPALFWMILSEKMKAAENPRNEDKVLSKWKKSIDTIFNGNFKGWGVAREFVMMQYTREAMLYNPHFDPKSSLAELSQWLQDLLWAETAEVWKRLKAKEPKLVDDASRTYTVTARAPNCPEDDNAYGLLMSTLSGQRKPPALSPGSENVLLNSCRKKEYKLTLTHAKNGFTDIVKKDVLDTLFFPKDHELGNKLQDRHALIALYAGVNMMLETGVDTPAHLIEKTNTVTLPFAQAGSLHEALGENIFGMDPKTRQCMTKWQMEMDDDPRKVEDAALPRVKDSMLAPALTMFTSNRDNMYVQFLEAFRGAIRAHLPQLQRDFDSAFPDYTDVPAEATVDDPGRFVCLMSAYVTLAKREDIFMPVPLVGLWLSDENKFVHLPEIEQNYVRTRQNDEARSSGPQYTPLEVAEMVCGQWNVLQKRRKLMDRLEMKDVDEDVESLLQRWVLVDCMTNIIFGSDSDATHQTIIGGIRAAFFNDYLVRTHRLRGIEGMFPFTFFDSETHCRNYTIGGQFFESVEAMVRDDERRRQVQLGKGKRLTFEYKHDEKRNVISVASKALEDCRDGNIIALMEAAALVRRKNLEFQDKFLLSATMHYYPRIFARSMRGIATLKSVEGVLKLFFDLFMRPDFLVEVFLQHYDELDQDEDDQRKKDPSSSALMDKLLKEKSEPEDESGEEANDEAVHAYRTRDQSCLAAIGVLSKAIFNSLEYVDLEANLRSKLQEQYAITMHMRVMEKAWKFMINSLPLIGGIVETIVDSAANVVNDMETMLAAEMQKLFADLKSIFLDFELILQSVQTTFESIRLKDKRVVDHLCYLLHFWCANPRSDKTCQLAFEKVKARFNDAESVCHALRVGGLLTAGARDIDSTISKKTIDIDFKMDGEPGFKSKINNFLKGYASTLFAYDDPKGVELSGSQDVTTD